MQFPTKGHAIKGLDNLTRLLARLKLHGLRSTNVDEVWDDGHVERSPNTRNSSNPLCALLVSLEESKLCMAALNEVRYHLEKRIRLVQKSCAPSILENGIKILPDEILSLAFEAGHRTTRSCHFANRVSRVSRRFRQISFRTPLLWTRLSVSYTDSQLQAFLSRSGQMDLDVSTMGGWDLSKVKLGLFIQTLQPYSHRWSHLRLQWNAEEIMGEQAGFTDIGTMFRSGSHSSHN
ncbi:hypothetical protein BD410DRAFT_263197 [Rickenella mellea]|uniref:Uncharacterized protein n=1 Tax=Rickenella mellea TaxID=50990 RepID=A0A4Y7Q6G1_9AGAM|nr:hypothetical protein BD410DRAFT_263197 [Rickenella mellea]